MSDYKKYIETLPCLICGGVADGHHCFGVGIGRNRKTPKWEDFTIIPLCRKHHQELHQIGIKKFEEKYKINLYKEALKILAQWIFNENN